MSEREPSEGEESRLRRVRPGSAEPARESGGEETPRRPEGEDPLEKVRDVGRRIAEGFRGGAVEIEWWDKEVLLDPIYFTEGLKPNNAEGLHLEWLANSLTDPSGR